LVGLPIVVSGSCSGSFDLVELQLVFRLWNWAFSNYLGCVLFIEGSFKKLYSRVALFIIFFLQHALNLRTISR
jgi:hypothetical protein